MGLNEVFKKVADIKSESVELAFHKIQLATLDQYNRAVFGDETWVTELTDFVTKSNDLKKQLETRIDGGLYVGEGAVKEINKTIALEAPLQKAIKDLGLPEPPEFKKNQEKIRKIQSQVNDLIKKLKSI